MGRSHGGWYLQQLVKLGASRYLPGLSDTFMVWDPDMIPLWPVTVFGERSATNGGKRKVFRQVGGYVIRSYEVSLCLVLFGYFWLFFVILVILVWAFPLTSCFVVTVYVSRRAWAKTGGTSAAEQARGVQQRRGERALSRGGDQWGADDAQPVAEPRQEGRRSERRLIPTAGRVQELLGN